MPAEFAMEKLGWLRISATSYVPLSASPFINKFCESQVSETKGGFRMQPFYTVSLAI